MERGGRDRGARLRGMMLLGAALFLAIMALASGGTVYAHASYVSSDPAADSVLAAEPTTVTIHFAEDVNPNGSDIKVYDAKGNEVEVPGSAHAVPSDLKTMTVNLRKADSEIYLVQWHNVSADDGDPDIGAFVFHVSNAPGAQATATASAKSGNTGGAGGSGKSSGAPGYFIALALIVGLALGAGGAFLARRRM